MTTAPEKTDATTPDTVKTVSLTIDGIQLSVPERHAREVIEVERAVDGCKRGRRHPVHPLQFRRHGAGPGIARCPPIRRSSSPHRSMEMVNEVFGPFYANPPVY